MSPFPDLREGLASGRLTPEVVVADAYRRLRDGDPAAIISYVPEELSLARARALRDQDPVGLPLYGMPFAVKDNIDVFGADTTAGCPAYAYTPGESAEVVRRLEAAGAIAIAKTNLDQFATGLVGTRSPYGTPRNLWDARRVPGGSSSGSAAVVASGAVPFALGTDTAGSGRVPAAFAGIVGVKPTRGLLSGRGVVPAVRSVDCVSLFALSVADGWDVLEVAAGFDPTDAFSRRPERGPRPRGRIGLARDIPIDVDLDGLGEVVEVDPVPFFEAGALLYGGPYVAERVAAVGAFIDAHLEDVDVTVAQIIRGGRRWSASDAAEGDYLLRALRRRIEPVWDQIDVLVLPTAPTPPTLAEVAADPVGTNAALGLYTTFANLLDLCAVAVPVGVAEGLPSGVQVLAPAWADATAAGVADQIHDRNGGLQGKTGDRRNGSPWAPRRADATVELAVVGAHLRGQPLHHQLLDLGAQWVCLTTTRACYRLYALPGSTPPKPGLVRTDEGGGPIEVEVYRLDFEAFGRFVAAVPPPLCIGTVLLERGSVAGFLCEPAAVAAATDITACGGWRAYLATHSADL